MIPDKAKTACSVSVVVHGCDRYLDLYQGFEHLFKKYWPTDLPFEYFLVTEEADFESEFFVNIKSGKGEWSDRLRIALDQVPTAYLIYFQEDFWLSRPFSRELAIALLDPRSILGREVSLLKLHSGYISGGKVAEVSGSQLNTVDLNRSEYLLSHQVSLWSKDFLLSCLVPGESAWENELLGSERLRKQKVELHFFELDEYYLPVSEKGFFHQNISYFFSEFESTAPYQRELIRRLELQIPHGYQTFSPKERIRIISLKRRVQVRFNKLVRGFDALVRLILKG